MPAFLLSLPSLISESIGKIFTFFKLEYEISELTKYSGNSATIYSILERSETETLFGKFIAEYQSTYKSEVKYIVERIQVIAKETGARIQFFKTGEGRFGDRVCALFDLPKQMLRLYCIRFNDKILILGGGGLKPAGMTAYQNDTTLSLAGNWMKEVAQFLNESFSERKIRLSENKDKLLGKLKNYE